MNYWTLPWKLGLLAIVSILSPDREHASSLDRVAAPACVTSQAGDLIDEVESLVAQMPGPGSDGMLVPSEPQMEAWQGMLDAVTAGDLAAACDMIAAHAFPYKIVRYTDSGYGGGQYLILQEHLPTTVGWGTYILADEPKSDLVIEVPHPCCEWNTERQGVELLRQTWAQALLIAGTDRCANTTYSPCSGTTTFCGAEEPHRTSDVGHATQTIFFASHSALVPPGTGVVAVQLHGCTNADCPDLFISNGTCAPGELALDFSREASSACAPLAVDVADCQLPECPLVGTTNVQGRYSNAGGTVTGFDACTQNAPGPSNPEQFLHLEQSQALRDGFGCLTTALRRTFLDLHQNYLPVVTHAGAEAQAQTVDVGMRAWNTRHRR